VHTWMPSGSPHTSLAVLSPVPLSFDKNDKAHSLFKVLGACAGDYGIANCRTEEILVLLFQSEDSRIRSLSVFLSPYVDPQLSIAMSRQGLLDREPEVRAASIAVAGWVASFTTVMRRDALRILADGLNDSDLRVRHAVEVLWALPRQLPVPESWAPDLAKQLADSDISSRIRALRLLSAIERRTCSEIAAIACVVEESHQAFGPDDEVIVSALILALSAKDAKAAVREIWSDSVARMYVDSGVATAVDAYLAGDRESVTKCIGQIGDARVSDAVKKLTAITLARLVVRDNICADSFTSLMSSRDIAITFLESLDASRLTRECRELLLSAVASAGNGYVRLYGQCVLGVKPSMAMIQRRDIAELLDYETSRDNTLAANDVHAWILSAEDYNSAQMREQLSADLTALVAIEAKVGSSHRLLVAARLAKMLSYREENTDGATAGLVALLTRRSLGPGVRADALAVAESLVAESMDLRDLCWQEMRLGTSTSRGFALRGLSKPHDAHVKR
jgi:hypothetical protein